MAKKPVKKSKKRPSGSTVKKRKPTARDAAGRKPQTRRPLRSLIPERDEDMYSAFSDDTNTFYTDERAERRRRAREESEKKKVTKKAQKRKPVSPTRRKLIRVMSYAAIVAVVLIVGVVLSLTVLFKTQVYEVTGNTRYAESEIVSTCGIGEGENIFLAPKSPAEKRIKNAYAYVEDVTVSFKIPDTIRISITEAVEGYLVKVDNTDYLVISTKGRILDRISDTASLSLPVFIGPNPVSGEIGDYVTYADETVVTMIDGITQTFTDNGYQGITEIDATDTADISFTYDDRIKVRLGIPEDLNYKIRTAMTIISENLDKNQTGSTKGVLDVSRCNSTKRSYFNEQEIHPTEQHPSEAATEPTGGSGTWDGGEYDWDSGYDWDDSGYDWDDSGYDWDDGGYDWDDGGESWDDGLDWTYDAYDENGYGYFY